ncbi:MarR family transcriptional regulator [Vibrio crassostreae]|uniref:MarR family transcriptional regulator n=1 Tax=Vibrio crassostreae TaxID=246167 RepID=UPI000F48286F|nr:helix-turn-helix domain-containing protein [Vibrio crassostreae]ROP20054.1 hypothetical protein EDB33_108124 [Vibrio crassostreae]ROP21855.1 hypothetical protein EDB34_108119 [Vibrio crassostreae]RPE97693.1 hypothetical protein EDB15_105154 [Vibrio crassostreae]TCV24022.1 hypothetical protein EDB11_105124 [Vibrio crassostreae]TWD35784.1 hypothetical protein FB442_108124 [Vibrio crassostreae]
MLDAFEGRSEIKAQDRLIYLRWLWLVHKDENKGMSIAEIASTLMLSESTVRNAIARLNTNDYLEITRNEEKASEKIYKLKNTHNIPVFFYGKKANYIQALLGVNDDFTKLTAESLARKFMKAALVMLSNDIGLVSNIGLNKLAGFTGLSLSRVRKFIDELLHEGLILKFIAGGNAPNLYPKCKSILILNPRYFGGALLKINNFPEERLFGLKINEEVSKALNKRNRKTGKTTLEAEVLALNKHRLAQRMYHYFYELVAESVAERAPLKNNQLITYMLAQSTNTEVNEAIKSSCSEAVTQYADFLLALVTQLEKSMHLLNKKIQFYCFKSNGDFFVVSNANKSFEGELEWTAKTTINFQGTGVSWELHK